MLPKYLTKDYSIGNAIAKFNEEIIDAVCDLVPVVKPQIAFYEQFGIEGLNALKVSIEYAREKGLLVLMDAKRNDIGSTAAAYASAYLSKGGDFESDALTVTPYLGSDGIKPFVKLCQENEKGLFILLKTSNPSSGEVQDLILEGGYPLYAQMASLIASWGEDTIGQQGFSNIGSVVGATYPGEAEWLRMRLPNQIFLVPGYGAQGGGAKDVLPCFNENKEGALVNSSRGILYAYKNRPELKDNQFSQAARDAVLEMKKDLESVL
jgi:orotidine-5'-phosphate decarboxylase